MLGDFRRCSVSPAPSMDMMRASLQGGVTYLLPILNVALHVFHILLFADLIGVYAFALQKRRSSFLPLLVRCFLPVAVGWPVGLRGGEKPGLKQLGSLPSGCITEWLWWGIGGHTRAAKHFVERSDRHQRERLRR